MKKKNDSQVVAFYYIRSNKTSKKYVGMYINDVIKKLWSYDDISETGIDLFNTMLEAFDEGYTLWFHLPTKKKDKKFIAFQEVNLYGEPGGLPAKKMIGKENNVNDKIQNDENEVNPLEFKIEFTENMETPTFNNEKKDVDMKEVLEDVKDINLVKEDDYETKLIEAPETPEVDDNITITGNISQGMSRTFTKSKEEELEEVVEDVDFVEETIKNPIEPPIEDSSDVKKDELDDILSFLAPKSEVVEPPKVEEPAINIKEVSLKLSPTNKMQNVNVVLELISKYKSFENKQIIFKLIEAINKMSGPNTEEKELEDFMDSVINPPKEVIEKKVVEPTIEPVEEIVEESMVEPAEEVIEEPVTEPVEEIVETSTIEPVEEIVETSTIEPVPTDIKNKAKPWFCPECGFKNIGKFCVECGTAKPNIGKSQVVPKVETPKVVPKNETTQTTQSQNKKEDESDEIIDLLAKLS